MAACRSRASTTAETRWRSTTSQDSKAGLEPTLMPSRSSPPSSSRAAGSAGSAVTTPRSTSTSEPTSVAAEQPGLAEGPAQLGQGPAQGPERVVGVPEQQLGQLPAPGGPVGQQQVGQQRPGLAAPRRGGRPAVALDGRRPEQADG